MSHAFPRSDEEFDSSNRNVDPGAGARAPSGPDANADLVLMIERFIIPRMMLAHGAERSFEPFERESPPSDQEVAAFAELAVRDDLSAALRVVEDASRRGLTVESLLLQLVAPAARLLGSDWEADRRSFTEVTAGTSTLQQVVNVLASRFSVPPFERGHVLLTAPEEEQHTLGLNILAEFLRRAGWMVELRTSLAKNELLDFVATEKLDAVGFTVSNERLLAPLARLVPRLRQVARDPRMCVFVGGPLPLDDFAAKCGAVCPGDAPSTVRWLERKEFNFNP